MVDRQCQQRYAEQLTQRLNGFEQHFLDLYNQVDAMTYEEQRAILREFEVQVTLWKRDRDPRFAIDWAFDLTDYAVPTGEEEIDTSWVIYTREAPPQPVLGFTSSGRSVNRSASIVRLRWTDRDLIALAAD